MAKKVKGTVRVGLIGAGGISGAHGGGFLKHADKIKVVALADISDKNLAARNEQLGGECATFKDWKKMLKQMDAELDAVDICLPHNLHRPAIVDAARAGKHIICEKPMCMTLKEADTILREVEKAGVTYMSAHNQLFMPVVQEAKKLIDSGALGKLRWLRSQDCFSAGRSRKQWGWRANLKTQGGGELIDTGYHPTYRLLYLAGAPVEAVRASFSRFNCRIDGEDTASVSVRFANGAIGEILTSWAFSLPYGSAQIHVMGDQGEAWGSGGELFFRPEGYSTPARRQLSGGDTFGDQLSHFADCLREGQRPLHGPEEGKAVLELILRAAESAKGWEETAPLKV